MKTLIYFNNYMYHKYQQCPYIPAVHGMGLLVVVGHLDPGGH